MTVENNILNRFIKKLILKGKKFKSYKIIYNSLRFIQKNSKKNPLIFKKKFNALLDFETHNTLLTLFTSIIFKKSSTFV